MQCSLTIAENREREREKKASELERGGATRGSVTRTSVAGDWTDEIGSGKRKKENKSCSLVCCAVPQVKGKKVCVVVCCACDNDLWADLLP